MYTWSENRRIDNLLQKSDVVIRPPLRDVYLTDNGRYDEIEDRGYNEGKKRLLADSSTDVGVHGVVDGKTSS